MKTINENHAEVVTQAEYILLASIMLGFVINYFVPIRILPKVIHIPLGIIILIAAIRILVLCVDRFQKAKTSISPYKPVKSLIMKGPYKQSRHPMYFGRALGQLGIGVLFGNIWILLMLIPGLIFIWYGVIVPEEKYLEQRFGKKYLDYKRSVRCWI